MGLGTKAFSGEITGPYSVCECTRCAYRWSARDSKHRPGGCPRCGSRCWDRPPERNNARTPSDPPNPKWGTYRPRWLCPLCIRPIVGGIAAIEKRKQKENWRQSKRLGGVNMMTQAVAPNARNLGPRPAKTNPDGTQIITPAERQLAEYLIKRYREEAGAGVEIAGTPVEKLNEPPAVMTPPPADEVPVVLSPPPMESLPPRAQASETPEIIASRNMQVPWDNETEGELSRELESAFGPEPSTIPEEESHD